LEPGDLGGEPANLGIELLDLGGMSSRLFGEGLGGAVGKEIGQASRGLIAPGVELIGMNAVLGGNLVNGAGFAPNLTDNLSFKGRAIGFAWCRHQRLLL
jgi:hypothetical protein